MICPLGLCSQQMDVHIHCSGFIKSGEGPVWFTYPGSDADGENPNLSRRDSSAGTLFYTGGTPPSYQLNLQAKPWIWGRPPKMRRHLRHLFCYCI